MVREPGFEVPYGVTGKCVWVASHNGMVGSAVVRRLGAEAIGALITASSSRVDLTRQTATEQFVARAQPDVAILAAAQVGAIHANRSAQGAVPLRQPDDGRQRRRGMPACRRREGRDPRLVLHLPPGGSAADA